MQILRSEIIASMEGKSKFPAEQIQQMYTQCQKELDEATNQLANLYTGQADLKHEMWETAEIIKKQRRLWKEFGQSEINQKRVILSHILKRVIVKRGYEIQILFAIDL